MTTYTCCPNINLAMQIYYKCKNCDIVVQKRRRFEALLTYSPETCRSCVGKTFVNLTALFFSNYFIADLHGKSCSFEY